jgi:hypothetical protein
MALACEDARYAFLDGKPTPEVDEHMRTCSGCAFFADMRKGLATASVGQHSGAFDSLSSLLGNATEGRLLHWRLDKRIGLGGQGIVFRAVDCRPENDGEVVALKLARFSAERIPRIAREVAIAHKVTHTNLCRVHSYDVHGDLALIVMEYVGGGSLKQKLKAPLELAEALRLFKGICDGVQAMHEAGVLHLDLKPENVLLRDGSQPAVADFGMSVEMGEGRIGGTRGYQPPEQIAGDKVDERTDVFALGKLLAKMVPEAPAHIASVIARATAEKPDDRYPTVAMLREALESPRKRKLRLRRPLAIAAAAVPGVLLLAYFIIPVPRTWNVARNTTRKGAPVVTTPHTLRSDSEPWELLDGVIAQQAGVAFHGDCGARSLEIDLGSAYRVDSIRVWYEGAAPGRLELEAEAAGVTTRNVHVELDTCRHSKAIVEVEVMARLSRWQSWRRTFAD